MTVFNGLIVGGTDCPTPSVVILGHRAEDPEDYQLSGEYDDLHDTVWILGSAPKDDDVVSNAGVLHEGLFQ